MSFNTGTGTWNTSDTDVDRRAVDNLLKHKPMTKEEEVEAFAKYKAGDQAAFDKIILSNQRFVVKMSKSFFGSRLPLSDLIQEGNIGMIRAAEKFNTNHGIRFITYARWWIRQSMQAASLMQGYTVRLPKRNWSESAKVLAYWNKFENEHGRTPTLDEMVDGTGLPVFSALVAQVQRAGDYSLDAELGDIDDPIGDKYGVAKFAVDPEQEKGLEEMAYKKGVKDLFAEFDGKHLEALETLLANELDDTVTLNELAKKTGVTRQAIDFRVKTIREAVQRLPKFKKIKELVEN